MKLQYQEVALSNSHIGKTSGTTERAYAKFVIQVETSCFHMASDSLLMLVEIFSILDLGQILEEVTGIVHPCNNILRLIYFIFNLLDVTSYQYAPLETPC